MVSRESLQNPFKFLEKPIDINGETFYYYDLSHFEQVSKLPFSIRVLLESALRNCDGHFHVKESDVLTILDWVKFKGEGAVSDKEYEISFKPSRVILQDANGIPAVVDFAAMREAVLKLGGDPDKINPICQSDLIIDHTIQVDFFGTDDSLLKNEHLELERNKERFAFLKWGAKAFKNMRIFPTGSGVMHQINMEYLAHIIFPEKRSDGRTVLCPDSVIGNDSHTTMINGLGVIGWGVGGIEAEAIMLGQTISLLLPEVIGYKLIGKLGPLVTVTDLALTVTQQLRQVGVVGKFVEFFGPGVLSLSVEERATISNMSPEFGATVGFFAIDANVLKYLRKTSRSEDNINIIEQYLKTTSQFRNYDDPSQDPSFSKVFTLDMTTVVQSISGPKRPQDLIDLKKMKHDFSYCLTNNIGFRGFELTGERLKSSGSFIWNDGNQYTLKHGSVVIAAIASSTNTSNPSVMLGAGLLATNAVKLGLKVAPYIKTSLSPGSKVVTKYLVESGVQSSLDKLGFNVTGYGCMTCIGKSGPLDDRVALIIEKNSLVCCGVLSGNRNFEGRIHPLTRANYLASPLLVIAYALAGRVDIDFESEPIGKSENGREVFLRDVWPTREEIQSIERKYVIPAMFKDVYEKIELGSKNWQALEAPSGKLFSWNEESTYIKHPPFFEDMTRELPEIKPITNARVLLNLGDSITTDHISPGGSIAKNSPAARFLAERGLFPSEYGSYSTRRGNDAIMVRGTFANARIKNKLIKYNGPKTIHFPSLEEMDIYDCAERYRNENVSLILLVGKDYGSGSSRDWAAKGPYLQGIKAVIAESYERIHRSNLVGMGIIPLQYLNGQNAESLGLNGTETFDILLPNKIQPHETITVVASSGIKFQTIVRFDTDVDVAYFKNGGILNYTVRKML